MMPKWEIKTFDSLTTAELYKILKLRNEVFVVEQKCIYRDTDGKDFSSHHLLCWDGDTLCAYARILPPGLSFAETSIGRVITSPEYRKLGIGTELVERSINLAFEMYDCNQIKISAQLYLQKFYEKFGFIKVSDVYPDDDILHIDMLLTKEDSVH